MAKVDLECVHSDNLLHVAFPLKCAVLLVCTFAGLQLAMHTVKCESLCCESICYIVKAVNPTN